MPAQSKQVLGQHIQPPARLNVRPLRSVFLAGNINMGTAPPWQREMAEILSDLPIVVYNPRRDQAGNTFDPTLKQDISNPKFKEQVDWEMDHLDQSDIIAMYFDPDPVKLSPITLLELGLHAQDRKLIVCCPQGLGRKCNVQIVCERFGIMLLETREDFEKTVRKEAERLCSRKSVVVGF
ncbi:uncharacterized protein BDR25DRAFT_374807 [Lindgomyces ingoldianus]|uniref:Uncharacterized protein n=1 Tax=Lindgomyces ingoldianus TaxID=673940 RepID=A0ACB6QKP5_9PLEO|nr:uncharacterized protein BDR25DRAFT_374807 [Lindgomyces ingoldianus]KAF2467491.1 hypothetical protein BDR25DRAFT_374807 [Lindgomyces ingoldianus]